MLMTLEDIIQLFLQAWIFLHLVVDHVAMASVYILFIWPVKNHDPLWTADWIRARVWSSGSEPVGEDTRAHTALPLTAEDGVHQQPGKRYTTMNADVTHSHWKSQDDEWSSVACLHSFYPSLYMYIWVNVATWEMLLIVISEVTASG